jgi:hypothetical protein
MVFKWCPSCTKSLVDSREFECYACQDRRYYYEEEWLGRPNGVWMFCMNVSYVCILNQNMNKRIKDKKNCAPHYDNFMIPASPVRNTPSDDAIFKTGTLVNRLVRSLLNHQIVIGPPHLLKATTSL